MDFIYPLLVLGGVGLLLGYGLAVASEKFYVEEDKRLEKINELLPGVNCGACGYPGCGGFAEGILEGDVTNLSDCKPGSKGTALEDIKKYLAETPGPDGETMDVKL